MKITIIGFADKNIVHISYVKNDSGIILNNLEEITKASPENYIKSYPNCNIQIKFEDTL